MEGYRPLQDPPVADLVKARKLLGYLKNVIHIGIDVTVGWHHWVHLRGTMLGNVVLLSLAHAACSDVSIHPESKCLHAFTRGMPVPGALWLAEWAS